LVLEIENGSRVSAKEAFVLTAKLKLRAVLLPLPSLAAEPAELAEGEAGRLRQAASRAGVTIAGLTGVMAGTEHRLVGGDTSRAAALARLQATVRLCTELGARLMCFGLPNWELLRSKLRPDQARMLAAEVLRRCGPLAESRRVTLCVSISDAGSAEKLVRKVDHPNIRLACDGAALKHLAQPVRDVRLARACLGDNPETLGKLLSALDYSHWLSLRLGGNETDAAALSAWLKTFRSAGGFTAEV
jgi:sugar phosphate isomerase/epimerase